MAEFRTSAGIEVLALTDVVGHGVDAFVTTRHGGVSVPPYDSLNLGLHVGDDDHAVLENRARVAQSAGVVLDDLVFMDQVHGTRVALVEEQHRGRGARLTTDALIATDALVTTTPHLPLVVLVADCAPVLLVDPIARVLGVAHAGWKGTVAGISQATLNTMVTVGAEPSRVYAVIGPSISSDSYEVGDEVASEFLRRDLGDAVEKGAEKPHVNLAVANTTLLTRAGLLKENIFASTHHSNDPKFFSDRFARPCGRFGLVATLT